MVSSWHQFNSTATFSSLIFLNDYFQAFNTSIRWRQWTEERKKKIRVRAVGNDMKWRFLDALVRCHLWSVSQPLNHPGHIQSVQHWDVIFNNTHTHLTGTIIRLYSMNYSGFLHLLKHIIQRSFQAQFHQILGPIKVNYCYNTEMLFLFSFFTLSEGITNNHELFHPN